MITDGEIIDVDQGVWIDTCLGIAEDGCGVVDWLSCVDHGDALSVLIHLVNPGTSDEVMVRTSIPASDPRLPSLAGSFPGVDWHEREASEMFGVVFVGREATPPLLLRTRPTQFPLRRDVALAERMDRPWPGQEEGRRKRRTLPPGVRSEWVVDDE